MPITRSASSCSVTRIVPTSAETEPPTRPAIITAASTGPICFTTDSAITPPSRDSCPIASNCANVSMPITAPTNSPTSMTTGMLSTPMVNSCGSSRRNRP